jgi:hypothetical protein
MHLLDDSSMKFDLDPEVGRVLDFVIFFCFHTVLEFNFWQIFAVYFVLYIIVFLFIYLLCARARSFSICLGDLHFKKN